MLSELYLHKQLPKTWREKMGRKGRGWKQKKWNHGEAEQDSERGNMPPRPAIIKIPFE